MSTRAPWAMRVAVHLERVDAVLEDVLGRDRVVRELAGLAGGHEARAELARERRAEDEAARLGRDDELDVARPRPVGEALDRRVERRPASSSSGVMSLNRIPGLGKSGMSRMWARRSTPESPVTSPTRRRSRTSSRCLRCEATAARFSSASIASCGAPGCASAAPGRGSAAAAADSRSARGAEHAQVAPGHAVAGELGGGAHDLALRLVVVLAPGARPGRARSRTPRARRRAAARRPSPPARRRASTARPTRGSRTMRRRIARRPARAGRRVGGRRRGDRRTPCGPPASSWRITRSGRNSSRCRRRIVRSRETSAVE